MKKLLIVTIYMLMDVEKCQDHNLYHTSCSVSSSIKTQITRPYDVVKLTAKLSKAMPSKRRLYCAISRSFCRNARSSSELAVFNASRRAETESGAPFEKAKEGTRRAPNKCEG